MNITLADEFPLRLKNLRKSRGWTLEQVGKKIGVTRGTIGNLENKRKRPSLETVVALAATFDVSIDYLVGASDEKGEQPMRQKASKDSAQEVPITATVVTPNMMALYAILRLVREYDLDYELTYPE